MRPDSTPVQPWLFPALMLGAALSATGCGGLYDFGGGSSSVNVTGTIQTVVIPSTTRNIVVFVYSDICDTNRADPVLCADLQLPEDLPDLTSNDYRSMRSFRVNIRGNGRFTVKGVKKGALTVAFLQDMENGADNTIDAEDITITRGPGGEIIPNATNAVAMLADSADLRDPRGTVDVGDIDIDFPGARAVGPAVTTTSVTQTTGTSVSISGTTTMPTVTTTTTLGPG